MIRDLTPLSADQPQTDIQVGQQSCRGDSTQVFLALLWGALGMPKLEESTDNHGFRFVSSKLRKPLHSLTEEGKCPKPIQPQDLSASAYLPSLSEQADAALVSIAAGSNCDATSLQTPAAQSECPHASRLVQNPDRPNQIVEADNLAQQPMKQAQADSKVRVEQDDLQQIVTSVAKHPSRSDISPKSESQHYANTLRIHMEQCLKDIQNPRKDCQGPAPDRETPIAEQDTRVRTYDANREMLFHLQSVSGEVEVTVGLKQSQPSATIAVADPALAETLLQEQCSGGILRNVELTIVCTPLLGKQNQSPNAVKREKAFQNGKNNRKPE